LAALLQAPSVAVPLIHCVEGVWAWAGAIATLASTNTANAATPRAEKLDVLGRKIDRFDRNANGIMECIPAAFFSRSASRHDLPDPAAAGSPPAAWI
jgi:hypothetical protein